MEIHFVANASQNLLRKYLKISGNLPKNDRYDNGQESMLTHFWKYCIAADTELLDFWFTGPVIF